MSTNWIQNLFFLALIGENPILYHQTPSQNLSSKWLLVFFCMKVSSSKGQWSEVVFARDLKIWDGKAAAHSIETKYLSNLTRTGFSLWLDQVNENWLSFISISCRSSIRSFSFADGLLLSTEPFLSEQKWIRLKSRMINHEPFHFFLMEWISCRKFWRSWLSFDS